jgi:hypothetical protein
LTLFGSIEEFSKEEIDHEKKRFYTKVSSETKKFIKFKSTGGATNKSTDSSVLCPPLKFLFFFSTKKVRDEKSRMVQKRNFIFVLNLDT